MIPFWLSQATRRKQHRGRCLRHELLFDCICNAVRFYVGLFSHEFTLQARLQEECHVHFPTRCLSTYHHAISQYNPFEAVCPKDWLCAAMYTVLCGRYLYIVYLLKLLPRITKPSPLFQPGHCSLTILYHNTAFLTLRELLPRAYLNDHGSSVNAEK